jgi:hypothetical protein
MSSNPIKDPKNLESYLISTYAPLIHSNIRSLKAAGKIPDHMEDWEFHEPAIKGLMEAVHAYNPEIAARVNPNSNNPFATLANSRIRGRIQDHADSMHAIPKYIRRQAKRFEAFNPQQEAAPAQAGELPKPKGG